MQFRATRVKLEAPRLAGGHSCQDLQDRLRKARERRRRRSSGDVVPGGDGEARTLSDNLAN